ncbi:MAG: thiazole biosynthesis adenylyltransferase ThiF [Chloroflexi bacterium]|nr:thiazole biosynthesis adenylyltransferase ThiF [Chloroflexota bacterium]
MGGTNHATLQQGRYAKQVLFKPIGPVGQDKISRSAVTVVGLGALGTVIASNLCRAGVGRLRLVDRDLVELSNLQRQILFDEQDALQRLPKVVAAAAKLRAANSEVQIEALILDVSADNVERVIEGSTVVLDGTDNLETRFLLNDACLKTGMPWIYGGALGSTGNTMTIVPGETPCLRCLIGQAPPPGSMPSCDTEGVLAATTGVVASIESAEALRLIVGYPPRSGVLCIDVWEREFIDVGLDRRPDCPACGLGEYEYLSGERTSWTTVLCGRNAVQIVPPEESAIALPELQKRLARIGAVTYNGFLLSFQTEDRELVVFPTGRAIIRGTTDEAEARSLYTRYVGA